MTKKHKGSIRVTRFDFGNAPISGVKKTTQGFLRIPASLTRAGVFKYRTKDGREVSELRHPDDVFKPESLATLEGAPLTIGHQTLINPENVGELQTGFVSQQPVQNKDFVDSKVTVQRKDAIDAVNSRELVELSPGYTCDVDLTPGTYEGQRYDQRQTNIMYNHVALLKRGGGRSGPEVALRMDNDAFAIEDEEPEQKQAPASAVEERTMRKTVVHMDGVTYTVELAEELAPSFGAALQRRDNERNDAVAELATVQGQLAASKNQLEELQKRFDAASSPEALQQAAKDYAETVEKARLYLKDARFDGKNVLEIKKETLVAAGFDRVRLDSAHDGFVEGAFAALHTPAKRAEPAKKPGVTFKNPEKREDAKEERTPEQARQEMIERNASMYMDAEG